MIQSNVFINKHIYFVALVSGCFSWLHVHLHLFIYDFTSVFTAKVPPLIGALTASVQRAPPLVAARSRPVIQLMDSRCNVV